jgi:diacylglycerol diphosphate phosphatase / phosphatidate phosphatase
MRSIANIYRFFAGQMHVFRPRTDLARVLLALAPLIGAALIAISRCEDYRHDVYDVTTGSLLGILVAYFSYRRYYPGLSSSHCDQPYPSRVETANVNGFAKVRDEEDGIADAGAIAMMDLGAGLDGGPLRQARADNSRSSGSRSDPR